MKTLQKMMRKVKRGQGGFTLIELLVVVAILGVIAAVVVLNVGGFMGRGTEEAANTEVHQVQTAIIAYMVDNTPTAGTIGPNDTTGPAIYLVDPGSLQATYTYDTSGKITNGVAESSGKWVGCTWGTDGWSC